VSVTSVTCPSHVFGAKKKNGNQRIAASIFRKGATRPSHGRVTTVSLPFSSFVSPYSL
jgi:hypothetical protein